MRLQGPWAPVGPLKLCDFKRPLKLTMNSDSLTRLINESSPLITHKHKLKVRYICFCQEGFFSYFNSRLLALNHLTWFNF